MRTGGSASVEMAFDGKTLTLPGKNANVYAQVEVPGTIDHLVDELRPLASSMLWATSRPDECAGRPASRAR